MTKQQRKILIKIIIGAVLFAVGMVVTHLLPLPWWAELLIFLAVYLVQRAGKGSAEHCTRAGV